MSLQRIREWIDGGISAGALSLSTGALDAPRLEALLARACGEHLRVEGPRKLRDDASAVTVAGRLATPFLRASGVDIQLEFLEEHAQPELRATFSGFEPGWRLSDAFTDLSGTVFERLAYTAPSFTLDSRGGPVLDARTAVAFDFPEEPAASVAAALHGLTFRATVAADGLAPELRRLALAEGAASVTLSGPLALQDGRAKLRLAAEQPGALTFPSLTLPARLELASVLDYSKGADAPRAVVFGAVAGDWPARIGERSVTVPVRAAFIGDEPGFLSFRGAPAEQPPIESTALAPLFGRAVKVPAWPAGLPGMGAARLAAIACDVSPATREFLSSEAMLATDGEWAPFGDWLRFHDLRVHYRADASGEISVMAGCRAHVAGAVLEGTLHPSQLAFSVQLAAGSRIALGDLVARLWSLPPGELPALDCTALAVSGNVTSREYGFVAEVETNWPVPLGPVPLALTRLRAELAVANGTPSGSFMGEVDLGGNRLFARVSRDGAAKAWRFDAGTSPGVPLDVAAWLRFLDQHYGVRLPSFFKEPRIDAVAVSVDFGTSEVSFAFGGALGITLDSVGSVELLRLGARARKAAGTVDWEFDAVARLALGDKVRVGSELKLAKSNGVYSLALRAPDGKLEANEAPRLADIVTLLVPAAEPVARDMGDLALDSYGLEVGSDGAFALSASSRGAWKLPFGNALTLSALGGSLKRAKKDGALVASAALAGTLGIGAARFTVKVDADEKKREISLEQGAEPLDLQQLVTSFAPAGTSLPLELGGLEKTAISGLRGAYDFAAGSYGLAGTVSLARLDAAGLVVTNATGTLELTGTRGQLERLSVSVAASVAHALAPELKVDRVAFSLELKHTQDKGWRWHIGGELAVRLFDLPQQVLKADASNDRFEFTWESKPLLAWQVPGVVDASFERVSLAISRDPKTNRFGWRLGGAGGLALGTLPRVSGTLSLGDSDETKGILFIADERTEPLSLSLPLVPGDERLTVGASLRLARISFLKTDAWELSASTELTWRVPAPSSASSSDPVDRLLAVVGDMFSRKLTSTLSASKKGVTLQAKGLPRAPVPFPVIVGGSVVWDRLAHVGVDDVTLTLGASTSLAARLVVGLPEEVNNVFGEENGRPKVKLLKRELGLGVVLDAKQGLGLEIDSSPVDLAQSGLFREEVEETPEGRRAWTRFELGAASLRFGEFPDTETPTKKWWHFDFGAHGEVRFLKPRLSFNGTDFTASGGFDIVRSVRLPTAPARWLLQRAGLEGLAAKLPATVAPLEIHVLDDDGKNGKTLNVGKFIDTLALLNRELGLSMPVEALRGPAQVLSERFNQLPQDFREYLDISIPRQFEFDFALTPATGCGMRFSVRAPKNPLKLLVPTPVGFQGITLRKLSFGETFGGNLLVADMDLELDQFDLVTLAASAALPKELTDKFTDTGRIQRKLILKNVFWIIVYHTQVPIPIPVWFDRVGTQYLGLEGLRSQLILRNNLEDANVGTGIRGLPDLFRELKAFFTDANHELPPDLFSRAGLNLGVNVNPGFLQLPSYLGKGLLGKEGELFRLGIDELLVPVVNFLKKPDLGKVLRLVPLEYRNGAIGAGQQPLALGPFELRAAWLFATLAELDTLVQQRDKLPSPFVQHLFAGGAEQGDQLVQSLREVAAKANDGRAPEGVILYQAGDVAIPGLSSRLRGFAGLLANKEKGLLAQFRITGNAGNVVALDTGGRFLVARKQLEGGRQSVDLALDGDVLFTVLGHDVLRAGLALEQGVFRFAGELKLFPPDAPFKANAGITGYIRKDALDIRGKATVALPPLPAVESELEIAYDHAVLVTRWFDQDWRLSLARDASGYVLTASAPKVIDVLPDVLRISDARNGEAGPALALRAAAVPSATLSGKLSLPKLSTYGAGTLTLRPNGVEGWLSTQFLGRYTSSLTLRGQGLDQPGSFEFTAALQGNVLGDLARDMHTAFGKMITDARELTDKAEKLFNEAWAAFKKLTDEGYNAVRAGLLDTKAKIEAAIGLLDAGVDKLLQSLRANDEEIATRKRILDELSRHAEAGLRFLEQAVDNALRSLDGKRGELNGLENWYFRELNDWGRFWNFAYYAAQRARLWLELEALEAILRLAKQELERARNALPVIDQGLDAVLQQLDRLRNGFLDELQKQRQAVLEQKRQLDHYNQLLSLGAEELLKQFGTVVDSTARDAAKKVFDDTRAALGAISGANDWAARHNALGLPFELDALSVAGRIGAGGTEFTARADIWVNTFETRRLVPGLTITVDFDKLAQTAANLAKELWEKRDQLHYDDAEARRREAMAAVEAQYSQVRALRAQLGPQFGETLEKKLLYDMNWTELASFYEYAKAQLENEETLKRFPILKEVVPLVEQYGGPAIERFTAFMKQLPKADDPWAKLAYEGAQTLLREAEREFKARFAQQLRS